MRSDLQSVDSTCIDCSAQLQESPQHLSDSRLNCAFVSVAQEVSELLQHAYPSPMNRENDSFETVSYHPQTIAIRAIAPEYKQTIAVEPLTPWELEVLQLIVDGYTNLTIARKLYITADTVKAHVHNVLRKLCVEDRTQAAIRALRSGLID